MSGTADTPPVAPCQPNAAVEALAPAELILQAATRLFLDAGFTPVSMDQLAAELGMSKKTLYRHFASKRAVMQAVLDRLFDQMEATLGALADVTTENLASSIERFLLAAGTHLARIRAPQLALRHHDAVLSQYVEQRVEVVLYQRFDRLVRTGWDRGLLQTPPEVLTTITRAALQELLRSDLPNQLRCSAADLLRSLVHTVLYGALGTTHPANSSTNLATYTDDTP